MEFLKSVLGEDYDRFAEKIAADGKIKIVNAADGSYIPKAKFDEARNEAKAYKAQIDEMNAKLGGMAQLQTDADGYKTQIAELRREMETKETEHARERLSYRAKDALRAAKVKNADLAMRLIDAGKLSEKDGAIMGLDEQIESLKKTDGYLFDDEPGAAGGVDTAREPGAGKTLDMNKAIRKMAGY